ncbi:hypothetical protein JCM33374_g2995 [Metschnikowia sp. JCM 33374]|nr:hypothetical protein JCM33374_g2995 [Metschnikowia sp. JCM 33374]
MPLFAFDEEELSAGLSGLSAGLSVVALDADSPTIILNGSQTSADGRGINIPQPRRRSSVYRRVSIKSSMTNGRGIAIPSDFGSIPKSENRVFNKKSLADFRPLKVLGQGAYGKVHLVQDRHDGKLYAQKQIRKPQIDIFEQKVSADAKTLSELPADHHVSPEVKSAANNVQRTIAERHILSEITHHVNIVKLFYALQDEDKFYLLLEYIPGGELFHHLTSNNSLGNVFLEEHVAFYAAQMALGIKHLHSLGIVYRDLKPENCLLNSAGHLVLTDFGLSKNIGNDGDADCRSIIGTPEYMAPEIIKGEAYGYPVDWWSLGCVIFDMMTGKPPFTGKTHKTISDKIIKSKPSFPFYLSLDAKDILGKLLQKNPSKRMAVDEKWATFKAHRFFRKINWDEVENQSAVPPVIPVITDPALAENFSNEFTGMKISDYDLGSSQACSPDPIFKGFSYTASHSFFDRYNH